MRDCSDNSDELSCPCDEIGEWTCGDGSCIPLASKCDGQRQCRDGSDEQNCCLPPDIACAGGRCVEYGRKCDGQRDCPLGEDEVGCPKCRGDQLTCGDGTCLDNWAVCNGVRDCSGGEDEFNCPTTPRESRHVERRSELMMIVQEPAVPAR